MTETGPAYVISAYHRSDLLFRLIDRLGNAPVAVHVDKKSLIWSEVLSWSKGRANVTLLPRHTCHWGLFGHVEASLEGLRWFADLKLSHIILLTGQCYPLLSATELDRHLIELGDQSVMEAEPFPRASWSGERGGYNRIERFYVHIPGRKAPRRLPLVRRTVPYNLHPFGGAGYWCLARGAAEYILAQLSVKPALTTFFKATAIPDESFFQTILMNSPFASAIQNRAIHFFVFNDGAASPNNLNVEQALRARDNGFWFARKFDDITVLDQLDERISR